MFYKNNLIQICSDPIRMQVSRQSCRMKQLSEIIFAAMFEKVAWMRNCSINLKLNIVHCTKFLKRSQKVWPNTHTHTHTQFCSDVEWHAEVPDSSWMMGELYILLFKTNNVFQLSRNANHMLRNILANYSPEPLFFPFYMRF